MQRQRRNGERRRDGGIPAVVGENRRAEEAGWVHGIVSSPSRDPTRRVS
jgi:hypothetical protein